MNHELTIGPARLPVDLNMAKLHLHVEDDDTEEDATIIDMIDAARIECERQTKRALITQTWTLWLPHWPGGGNEPWWDGVREGSKSILTGAGAPIRLPRPPLQSVSVIRTYDDADAATTFASGNYFVDTAAEPGRVHLRKGVAAPVVERVANGLEVVYVAGFGDHMGDIPSTLRQGILKMVAHLHEHRGDGEEKAAVASGAADLWRRYQIMSV